MGVQPSVSAFVSVGGALVAKAGADNLPSPIPLQATPEIPLPAPPATVCPSPREAGRG